MPFLSHKPCNVTFVIEENLQHKDKKKLKEVKEKKMGARFMTTINVSLFFLFLFDNFLCSFFTAAPLASMPNYPQYSA